MNQEHTDNPLNGFTAGLLIGGLLGASAMLLFAPQSGKKTQQMIRRQTHQLQRTAEDTVEGIRETAVHTADDVRDKVAEVQTNSQEWLKNQAAQASKIASKMQHATTN